MMTLKKNAVLAIATALMIATSAQAVADPLPGQILKFQQLPMDATPIDGALYYGHDEFSTAYGQHGSGGPGMSLGEYGNGQFMADDFADEFDTAVVHIRWWGSFPNSTNPDNNFVRRFLISFETDVPQSDTNLFSHPGQPLLTQISDATFPGGLFPGSGTFTQKLISPGGPPLSEALYEYNAELACPFEQKADTVYWLKIVALVDPDLDGDVDWGWHNRDYTITNLLASPNVSPGETAFTAADGTTIYHFQDDAVSGVIDPIFVDGQCNVSMDQFDYQDEHYVDLADGPIGISQFSKDLAFELYTVPEPSAFVMLLLGAVALGARSGRIRRREAINACDAGEK